MTPQDIIKSELFMLAWREGHRRGGAANMLAVALVVRNRVRSGWLGGDWMRVIDAHEQWHAGDFQYKPSELLLNQTPDFHAPAVRELLAKIDDVFSGAMPDVLTEGSLYYAELNRVDPEYNGNWFKLNILDKPEEHKRVAMVGVVSFFL